MQFLLGIIVVKRPSVLLRIFIIVNVNAQRNSFWLNQIGAWVVDSAIVVYNLTIVILVVVVLAVGSLVSSYVTITVGSVSTC